jgi:TRAP-type C4-dicarboxylate transport system substrate-binding protein
MLDLKWAPLIGATVISKKSWDATPAASRDALTKAAAEAGDRFKGEIRGANDKAIEAMVKRGLVVHPVTPDVLAEWRKAAESAYPKIRGTLVPAEMFDEAVRLTREYRAGKGSSPGSGTPGG